MKELLELLELTNKEFRQRLPFNLVHPLPGDRLSLADVAFRLRDKMNEDSPTKFYSSLLDVQNYVLRDTERAIDSLFWALKAQPKHWIVAALIARRLKEQGNS